MEDKARRGLGCCEGKYSQDSEKLDCRVGERVQAVGSMYCFVEVRQVLREMYCPVGDVERGSAGKVVSQGKGCFWGDSL